jgi:restriction endonuclease S subunit
LNEQETAIEKLQAEIEKLRKTYETQRADLENYLINASAS